MADQRASGYEKEGPRRPTVSCALAPIEPSAVASNKRSSCELIRRRRFAARHDSTTRNRSCLLQTTGLRVNHVPGLFCQPCSRLFGVVRALVHEPLAGSSIAKVSRDK